jgi:hypothetical protein
MTQPPPLGGAPPPPSLTYSRCTGSLQSDEVAHTIGRLTSGGMKIWVSDKASTRPLSVSCAIVPLAECEWRLLHDEIVQRGAAFRERGAALRSLTNRTAVAPGSVRSENTCGV